MLTVKSQMTEYQVHGRKTNFKTSYVLHLTKIMKGRHDNISCISTVLYIPWPVIRTHKIMQFTFTKWNGFSLFSYLPKIKTVTSSLCTTAGGTAAFLYFYAVLWNRHSHICWTCLSPHTLEKTSQIYTFFHQNYNLKWFSK